MTNSAPFNDRNTDGLMAALQGSTEITTTITTTHAITDHRLADLLCTALEGGVGYWAQIVETEKGAGDGKPWGDEYTPSYISCPFSTGGFIKFKDTESDDTWTLDRAAMERGLKRMAEKTPAHFADFINENADATTGDVFLQLCFFEEVTFG